jgi:hypothetical protein
MNLTTRQKQLALVLAIGVAGLALDRLVFGPAEGSAASADYLATPAASGTSTIAGPDSTAPSAQSAGSKPSAAWGARSVSARLAELARSDKLGTEESHADRDPFHLPRQAKVQEVQTPTAQPAQRNLAREAAEAFAARHQLRATMGSGPRGMVLISDRMVRLGEGLEGWKLVGMDNTTATFEKDGLQVRFVLSDQSKTNPNP